MKGQCCVRKIMFRTLIFTNKGKNIVKKLFFYLSIIVSYTPYVQSMTPTVIGTVTDLQHTFTNPAG